MFIALFVEYPEEYRWCFLLCHNLRLHAQAEKLWYCSFCFMCSIAMPYLLIKTRPPHFKTRKFWPTYENAWIRPCLSRSTQMSSLCRFTSRRQAEWTPLQASCFNFIWHNGLSLLYGNCSISLSLRSEKITWQSRDPWRLFAYVDQLMLAVSI